MSKLLLILFLFTVALLTAGFFIPASQTRTVPVRNTINNTIAALHHPSAWRSVDSGRNTRISDDRFMLYTISEPGEQSEGPKFTLSVTPDLSPAHNINIASITYFHSTTVLYKVFPILEKTSPDARIVQELRAYLEDNTRFYGFPISTQKIVDSFFLTKKQDLPSRELLSTLPSIFKELKEYARAHSCRVLAQNISVSALGHDSISLMAGLNIDKPIDGDYIYNFRQLPSTLGLVVAHYQGPFGLRKAIYAAVERFIPDHGLAKTSLPYERYFSGMPASDSSVINIDLLYPVTYR